ncbi:MAG: YopX family protein [Bacteroidota bacterium]|nr:YopX family protein [Bacteroidota bacterium]
MQREIKFRAFEKEAKTMHKVSSIDFENKEIFIYDKNGFDKNLSFDEIELMQFTGLKDKNGTEVYEGDVLFLKEGYNSWRTHVVFTERGWHRNYDYPVGEIIGNIHQNPDIFK